MLPYHRPFCVLVGSGSPLFQFAVSRELLVQGIAFYIRFQQSICKVAGNIFFWLAKVYHF